MRLGEVTSMRPRIVWAEHGLKHDLYSKTAVNQVRFSTPSDFFREVEGQDVPDPGSAGEADVLFRAMDWNRRINAYLQGYRWAMNQAYLKTKYDVVAAVDDGTMPFICLTFHEFNLRTDMELGEIGEKLGWNLGDDINRSLKRAGENRDIDGCRAEDSVDEAGRPVRHHFVSWGNGIDWFIVEKNPR